PTPTPILTGVGFLHLGRESGIGNRESGIGNRESGIWNREEVSRNLLCIFIHMGRSLPELIVYFYTYGEKLIFNESTYSPLCKKPTLVSTPISPFPHTFSSPHLPISPFPHLPISPSPHTSHTSHTSHTLLPIPDSRFPTPDSLIS
ncbi:MAG: hypothetical protein F6K50_43520, partial [Moorea sp. SIO3I7]|nr:hypothetical protein [Moorena sp. SIO3I7]